MATLPQANGKSSFTQSSAFRHRSTTTRIWSFCGGDRFTGDRRRQTEKERLSVLAVCAEVKTNPAHERGYSLRLNLRDVRDCLKSASQARSSRVPEDWFTDLENKSKDLLPISALKPWLISDLTDPPSKPSRAPGYVQVAIAGIMMGDKKRSGGPAKCAATGASVLWSPHCEESPASAPFPREPVFGDVYVDDLAVLAIVETSNRAFAEDHLRMNRVDAVHADLGTPITKPAGDGDFEGPFGALTSASVESLGFRCADQPHCFSPLASEPVLVSTERAVEEAPWGLGVHPLVPTRMLQPRTLQACGSSLERIDSCVCARAPVLGCPALASSQRTLRLRRLGFSCRRVSSPGQ